MLSSNNPAFPSPPPELRSPYAHSRSPLLDCSRAPPRGSGSSSQFTALDGSGSPRQAEKTVAPSRPPAQPQQLQQHHPFNAPRPSLSPLSEYHSGFSDADIGVAPYSPANSHRRQHSFPNLLPAAFRSRTPSPTRKASKLQDTMPLTGDNRPTKVDSPKAGGLAGWFSNMSSQDDDGASTADITPTRARRAMTTTTNPDPSTPKSTVTSRFMSAISSRFTSTPTSPIIDDELCNLNIEGALFPPNSPRSDHDPFSPAAFKNLQMNALGLLARFQGAYRDRVATVRELQAEKLAQREELEEAETRARHLKMQLEGMARKAQEQEKEMQALMEELAAERKARVEAEKLVTDESLASEDLGVDEDRRRRKWVRKSGETIKSEGDFETDEESAESESVFSRCRSPTMGMIDGNSTVRSNASIAPPRRGQQKEMNAFQKIIKGISGDATEEAGPSECRNCKGQNASVAWDTVSLLRDENKHLKVRVSELETAVEGALDLVNGIGA